MYRLSLILNLMKQCVHSAVGDEIRPGQYMKYQAYYHVLARELKQTRELAAKLSEQNSVEEGDSEENKNVIK